MHNLCSIYKWCNDIKLSQQLCQFVILKDFSIKICYSSVNMKGKWTLTLKVVFVLNHVVYIFESIYMELCCWIVRTWRKYIRCKWNFITVHILIRLINEIWTLIEIIHNPGRRVLFDSSDSKSIGIISIGYYSLRCYKHNKSTP